MEHIENETYFMAIARLASKRSKDPSTQVGACIVNHDNVIVGIGYNCMPKIRNDDVYSWKKEVGTLDNKYLYVCHAELNAFVNKTTADVKGCTIYVTLFPCNECAKLIIQSGIKEVVYMSDKYAENLETKASWRMLRNAGIQCRQFTSSMKIEINFTE